MAKQNFLLLSLDDLKAKKVANIVGNDSCRKILDFLAENEATETEIAAKLSLPISTVHYNLDLLKTAGLVDWDKYHYSEKGKEVKHYKLVNKYIIIAPKNDPGFLEKLKNLFPAFLLSAVGAFGVYFASNFEPEQVAMMESYKAADDVSLMAMDTAMVAAEPSLWSIIVAEPAFWFLLGAFFGLGMYLLYRIIRKR